MPRAEREHWHATQEVDVRGDAPDDDDEEEDPTPSPGPVNPMDEDDDEADRYPITGRDYATHFANLVDILERPLTDHEIHFVQNWWRGRHSHFLTAEHVAAYLTRMQIVPDPDFDPDVATSLERDIYHGREIYQRGLAAFASVLGAMVGNDHIAVTRASSDFHEQAGRRLSASESRVIAERVTSPEFVATLSHIDLNTMGGIAELFSSYRSRAAQNATQVAATAQADTPTVVIAAPASGISDLRRTMLWSNVCTTAASGSVTHAAELARYQAYVHRCLTPDEAAILVSHRDGVNTTVRNAQIAAMFQPIVDAIDTIDGPALLVMVHNFCLAVGRTFLLHDERGQLITRAEATSRYTLMPTLVTIEARLSPSSEPGSDWEQRIEEFDRMTRRASAPAFPPPSEPAAQQPTIPPLPVFTLAAPPPAKQARTPEVQPGWVTENRPWVVSIPSRHTLWRAATKIGEELEKGPLNPNGVAAGLVMRQFDAAINQFDGFRKKLLRQQRLVKQWKVHRDTIRELLSPVETIQDRGYKVLDQYNKVVENNASIKDIYKDLIGIWKNWGNLRIDFSGKTIETTIGPAVLQHPTRVEIIKNLGHFTIQFNWSVLSHQVSVADAKSFRIIAEHPYPAHDGREVTHPHVNAEGLCPGTAKDAIILAVRQGRLFDCFEMITQVLLNYGANNPYRRLDEWDPPVPAARQAPRSLRIHCRRCSNYVMASDTIICDRCGMNHFCDDCATECETCHRNVCRSCSSACAVCESHRCARCLISVEDEREDPDTPPPILLICNGCLRRCDFGDHDVPADRFDEDLEVCHACLASAGRDDVTPVAVGDPTSPRPGEDTITGDDSDALRELSAIASVLDNESQSQHATVGT